MRLLNLLEDGQPIIAYHGSTEEFDTFNPVGSGTNYNTLGSSGDVDRHGIFFSLDPEFSKSYGNVKKYQLDIKNLVNIDVRVEVTDWFTRYIGETHPDLERDVAYIHNYGPKWELFDDEIGELFSEWIQSKGYDAVQFWEDGGETIVVFDPTKIKEVGSVTESFFSDNADVLMPVVRSLMRTGARPLIYKLWKKSPNAVLALAAIKRLHDKGDENPLLTIERLSNIDVPIQFLKRLAWDAGLHDIPGVSAKDKKPGLLPGYVMASQNLDEDQDMVTVWHVTPTVNMNAIQRQGLVPKIGQNSADYGEPEEAIHVFLKKDSMEDAIANWDMASWGEEDEVPLTAIEIELPQAWLEDDPEYPKMIALVKQPIPTSRFVNITNNI